MISKFASMRDSWFTKIILTVTALSFMSLFGVTGYINSANNNKTVMKVDKFAVSQSEFSHMLQKELSKLRATGMLDEESDNFTEIKNELINSLAKSKLDSLIIENTMKKYNVDFTDSLIRNIIYIMPQFLNQNGQFDREAYKWFLSRNNQTENELIQDIKRNVARKVMIDSQVAYANIPEVMVQQMMKVLGQRRTFKYVKVVNDEAKITRQPTEDELDQYYEDLSEEFTIPEKRNISVLFLSLDDIEKNIQVTDEEINAYYKEHIEEFEQPEQREVLQMVFENKDEAEKAAAGLASGSDFVKVAVENGQNAEDVNLGFVAQSDLSDELAEVVFGLKDGEISPIVNIADSWQIIKVVGSKAAAKVDRQQANAQIISQIRQDKAYEGSADVMAEIEDKIGAGATLEEVADVYGVKPIKVTNLSEAGTVDKIANDTVAEAMTHKDVVDTAFSYNEGEISQAVEDDNGIVVVRVDEIIAEHLQPREEAEARIKKIWLENEKSAITQETVDNIEHDLDAGDALNEVATRYGLRVTSTMPLNRQETFADLPAEDIMTLFTQPKNQAKIVKAGDNFIVAETSNIYDDSSSLSQEDKNFLLQALSAENSREMGEALLKDFASDYKIEVNYNRMGLTDE